MRHIIIILLISYSTCCCISKAKISNTTNVVSNLKSIIAFAKTFKKYDLDKNGLNDYPNSVCDLKYKGNCNLLSKEIADSDLYISDCKPSQNVKPYFGYYYTKITVDTAKKNDREDFRIVALPAKKNRKYYLTYIANAQGEIYCKLLSSKSNILSEWPRNPEKEGWEKLR